MRVLMDYRFAGSLVLALVTGVTGLHLYPWPADHPALGLIQVLRPSLAAGLAYAYATLWFSTPFFAFSIASALVYIFVERVDRMPRQRRLPPYPAPETREDLFLVLGEQHYRASPTRAPDPRWLVMPARGLYTGMILIGATGSGKTSAALYPFVEQLVAYRATDPARKVAALVLEVKGTFCTHVRRLLKRHGREADYVDVGLASPYRYNPLHNDQEPYELASGIATLMTNLFGKGKDPFWQLAATNLVKFVILLHLLLDDYVTLFHVYEHAISPAKLRAKIALGDRRFLTPTRRLVVDKRQHLAFPELLSAWTWEPAVSADETWTPWSADREDALTVAKVPHRLEDLPPAPEEADKVARFEAVKRWFEDDWTQIDTKLRTSVVEGISVFLSAFDDNPRVKYVFCPPKELYDPAANPDGRLGAPLPSLADQIEQGKVVALNFPLGTNPNLARALGTMLKLDFQRAVLNRIPQMEHHPSRPWRPVAFICDEYQELATTGQNEPSGDERFFSLARQAKCMPIVATQSISSLRSTLEGESWRTLLQGLRTKVFLSVTDHVTAQLAADLCGRVDRLKPGYTFTEAGQDANVSLVTGRPGAQKTTVSTTKTYTLQREYLFEPKVFLELTNAQAIVLLYDGVRPQPPTYCYLKPDHLPVETSYFDHLAAKAL
jgi:hypothetical protein